MRKSIFICVLALLALTVIFTGCNISPEKSPSFIKLSQRVAELEEAQKKSDERVKGVMLDYAEVDDKLLAIRRDMAAGPAVAGGDSEALTLALQRIDGLEKKIVDLQKKLLDQEASINTTIAQQRKQIERQATSAPKATPTQKPAIEEKLPSVKRVVPSAKPTAPTTVKDAVPTVSKTAGFYYAVKSGDTLADLARRYNTSAAKICEANSLSLTSTLVTGQNIYIPGS